MQVSSQNSSISDSFHYIQESADEFLALFSHRYDYIWAPHPEPKQSPEWKTESRHPLSDRLVQQAVYLYGVRFGAETRYGLLDIDVTSPYHPRQDPLAIARMTAVFEAIGLVSYVACTSSYSGGLHVYFPFQQPQSSWKLAIVLATLLENAGFKLKPGHLEVFPNPKPYRVDGKLSLFNAHRLPLQAGSYLVNEALQPVWGDQQTFVQQWRFAEQRNCLDAIALQRTLKQAKRRTYQISGKADKFINDLNAEIELGWTAPGQTNRLLGRIALRAYIFNHVLSGGEPLEGQTLVDEIVRTAKALPGYDDYCRHRHEIEHRALEWALCVERSHYFHYGDPSGRFNARHPAELEAAISQVPTWNQQQTAAARDRIRRAIARLLETDALPTGATARFRVLTQSGIGGGSLYRHRDLWHPHYLVEKQPVEKQFVEEQPVEIPPNPPTLQRDSTGNRTPALPVHNPTSLFPPDGSNRLVGLGFSTIHHQSVKPAGNNSCELSAIDRVLSKGDRVTTEERPALLESLQSESCDPVLRLSTPQGSLSERPQTHRTDLERLEPFARMEGLEGSKQESRLDRDPAKNRQITRMRQFLASGDPILVAEAQAWGKFNPGELDVAAECPLSAPAQPVAERAGYADWSEVLAAISVQVECLGWTRQQVRDLLQQQFGKPRQALLTDSELMEWLAWLRGVAQ